MEQMSSSDRIIEEIYESLYNELYIYAKESFMPLKI